MRRLARSGARAGVRLRFNRRPGDLRVAGAGLLLLTLLAEEREGREERGLAPAFVF